MDSKKKENESRSTKKPKVENSRKLSDENDQRDVGGTKENQNNDNSKEQNDENNQENTRPCMNTYINTNIELKDFTDIVELKKFLSRTKLVEYFELIELIKKGGAGNVFKANFKTINTLKIAALKLISFKKNERYGGGSQKQPNANKEYNEDHSEILIHWKLKNKNIPEVYGYYSIYNIGVSIAMEFFPYRDLSYFKKNILKKHTFSETLLCYISSQVLNAILYLHQNRIIHMDVKINNILIDDYLNIKLCDFSVSFDYKSCGKNIELNNNGTIPYKSPEVMEERTISVEEASKIDVFSFGVVLFTLALCCYPYDIKNPKNKEEIKELKDEDVLKSIKDHELDFGNSKNSEMFKSFVKKCLDKDIKKRYNIFQALRDPWILGSKFILDEKEKLCNASKFLINMAVGNIIDFNKYIGGTSSC